MKHKLVLLGSVAALAGSVAVATPGFAQTTWYDHDSNRYYDTNPTPSERAQTNALNTQEAQNQGSVTTTVTTTTGADANAQYQEQQQQYQDQLQNYQDQRDHYHRQLMRYDYDRSHPRDWWWASYDRATLDGFYRVPYHDLMGRAVDERDGLRVGYIRRVDRAPDGRVMRVEVALRDDRVAWIPADRLRYDWDDSVMFTDVPADVIYDRSYPS